MKFDIKIKMTSDWHIGLGQSKGVIDSIVQRDKEGFPYIPAKTLTGILRDGCETIALGLDKGKENGFWNHCLNFLFGSQPNLNNKKKEEEEEEKEDKSEIPPQPAILSLRSAHLPKTLRRALNSKEKVFESIAFVKAGISIDNNTGCAKKDFLRFEEMIRTGATLTATGCKIEFPQGMRDNEKQMAYALLLAGVQITERIGGKRRRGAGKCQITIENENGDDKINFKDYKNSYIEFLSQQVLFFGGKEEGEYIKLLRQQFSRVNDDENTTNFKNKVVKIDNNSAWHVLPIEITTITPIIIPSRTIGNVVETLDYIPAKYLLRSLNNLFGKHINVFEEINNGNLVITNGTIMIDNQPSRPTPFSLFADKLEGGLDKGNVYNRFVDSQPDNIQLKAIRGGYISKIQNSKDEKSKTEDCLPKLAKAEINVYTHNTVQDESQRPSSDVGGVYSYNAIVPDTIFKAEIRLKSELLEYIKKQNNNNDDWWEKVNGEYVIGQSKKDDYGKVQIEAKSSESYEVNTRINNNNDNQEINKDDFLNQDIEIKDNLLYVWLLSDVLLRDKRLRPTADLNIFKETLQDALSKDADGEDVLPVKLIEREKDDLSLSVRQRRTESWQVRWRLPRPSLAGIQAGSCMVYQIKTKDNQTLDVEKLKQQLKQIQITGIGERKAEGYGQICFNDSLLTKELSQLKPLPQENNFQQNKGNNQNLEMENDEYEYARLIEKQAWREAILQKALALASDSDKRKEILGVDVSEEGESIPAMTQLGRLRSIIRKLQNKDDKTKLISWLDSIKEKEKKNPNSKKWGNDKLEIIRKLVNDKRKIWQHLSLPYDELTVTLQGTTKLQEELWAEAIRTLVDAIIRAHKRSLE